MQYIRKHGGNLKEASEIYDFPVDKFLDFSANINPLGPPPIVYEIIKENLTEISRYPDSRNLELKKALAAHLHICQNNLILGNGASELIFLLVNCLRPTKVWIPNPTFGEYEVAARGVGAEIIRLPLGGENLNNFQLDQLESIKSGEMIFICNPNNPTGQLYNREFITSLIRFTEKKKAYLVIDESFLDFLVNNEELSWRNNICKHSHLIILYSLTKFFAIPGLRLGALLANEELISNLDKLRDPWNVNVFAQLAGVAALKDKNFIKESLKFFQEEKDFVYEKLIKIPGLHPFKPSANFIFIKLLTSITSTEICDILARQGILVRNCNSYPYLGEKYLRIAIKKREDNLKLIDSLKIIMAQEND
ncbi:MAG: threonine-phosphate decarboxylase [Clostridia bacterium]|nr:threonine-phosphate decarboxylase [Clostridia bacterium]